MAETVFTFYGGLITVVVRYSTDTGQPSRIEWTNALGKPFVCRLLNPGGQTQEVSVAPASGGVNVPNGLGRRIDLRDYEGNPTQWRIEVTA